MEEWTNARLKVMLARTELTDEWKQRGTVTFKDFAILTNDISKGSFGKSVITKEYALDFTNKRNLEHKDNK